MTTARAILDASTSERDLQAAVVALLRLHGWRVHTVYDSRRSPAGWPDVFAVKDGRAIAFELKTERGGATRAQLAWLMDLKAVPGITARVVRPSDWDELERLAKGERV